MSPPKVRKAPARAPIAGTVDNRKPPRDSRSSASPQDHVADFADLERFIEAAQDYEKVLGRKQYFLRKLILNAIIKRDHLAALAESLRRAA